MKVFAGLALVLIVFASGFNANRAFAQTARSRHAAAQGCDLNGVYRINVPDSDKLYSAVEGATGKVPFREQQRFFIDLSVRLTPPDLLAIECRGSAVTIGSSRAAKVTFLADGKTRVERTAAGNVVRARVSLEPGKLSFTSNGKTEDNINVAFESRDDGERLLVTRHIYAEQLTEPIVVRTLYDKIADGARWDIYGETPATIAEQRDDETTNRRPRAVARNAQIAATPASSQSAAASSARTDSDADALRDSLAAWIAATNANDIAAQMRFYLPELKAYYLARNVSSRTVRAEKTRVFADADTIDIRVREPEIIFQDNGQTAVMRFRKDYLVGSRARKRSGAVVQELRWQQTNNGWKISSERDVKVLR